MTDGNSLRRRAFAIDADTLTVAGKFDLANGAFEKLGAGSLVVGNLRSTGTTTITAGTVRIRADGTNAGVSNVSALVIAGGAVP